MYNHKAAPFPPLCRLHCTTTCWSPFPDPCWPSCWPPFLPSCQLSCPSYPFSLLPLRDVAKKKQWENVGILKKQGGGLPESHFHFLLFFTWETPQKKVLKCKINHTFFFLKKTCHSQTGGRGGGPRLGKNSHIFPFFFWQRPLI